MAKGRQLSEAGMRALKREEGLRLHLYNDVAGHATIGYGHLVHRGKVGRKGCELAEQPFLAGISEAEAERLLDQDNDEAEEAVLRLINVQLAQHHFDALVSFTFNVGAEKLRTSTLRKRLNAGCYWDVPKQLLRWKWAGARPRLLPRRQREANIFVGAPYG